ncbi:hypothetical protein SAMN05660359_00095 [Geodermatophilus obscurus]|uniref:Uncharacterized protein n=1 Tax=Geodermatophilus obscurus TaxID=1861 RepID=A0A1I5C4S4_9ACTN|nr:hypothetical protein [Geodermatophilus obscurus]SFN82005.1 hypothetical protein SAMN05660359_00095 [Geodermatophilus obscurus]
MVGGGGYEPDWFGLLGREVLRERRAALIAEACAWSVGLSDRPHHLRLRGRLVATGSTIGHRAALGQPLSGEEDGRIELGDARPGSFQDALNAVDADGTVWADRFDREVIEPFVHETCVLAAERARPTRPGRWAELLDELGEDPDDADPGDVVRAGEWEEPLRTEAEHLVLAALGRAPLLEVESEGLPLSLVRAAEATARAAAAPPPAPERDEDLSAALFLALAAVREAGLPTPVPPDDAGRLLAALLEQGLEPEEVTGVLSHLRLAPGTADRVAALLHAD